MNKALMLLIAGLFFILIPTVYATEYDNPVIWYYHYYGDPVQAFHACMDDGGKCVSVIYNSYYDRLEVFLQEIPNGHDFKAWCPQYPSTTCSKAAVQYITPTHGIENLTWARIGGNWSNYHLPFGVTYWRTNEEISSGKDGNFYVWEWGHIYKLAINGSMYNYDDISDVSTLTKNVISFSGQPTFNTGYLYFLNTHNNIFGKYWISNKTMDTIHNPYPYILNCDNSKLEKFVWYLADDGFGHISYYYQVRCDPVGVPSWGTFIVNLSMPTTLNYTHYYLDGKVYGSIEVTGIEGIYTVDTDDFTSYTQPVLYYAYNTSVNEDINTSWAVRTSGNRIFQFDRFRNTTWTTYGIAMNLENLTSLTVNPMYWDDCITFLNCFEFDSYSNLRVRCDDMNYTSVNYYSNSQFFSIPCTQNVTIVSSTTSYVPYYSEITTNLPCPSGDNYITLIYRPIYNLNILAYDEIIPFLPIENAQITLGGITKTTNSDGKATFNNINPLISPYFTLYDNSSCTLTYLAIGTDYKYFSATVSHPEYETKTETFDLSTYKKNKEIRLTPKGIIINVRIFRDDGYELFPEGSPTTIRGANTTYYYSGVKEKSNVAYSYPAKFLLVDNRSYFNVNLTLEIGGKSYTTFYYEGAGYTSFNVSQDNSYNFIINVPSIDQPCDDNSDCLPSYCVGKTFHPLIGCINNVCKYSSQVCPYNCDKLLGCFKIKTTKRCNTTLDCDSICTGNFTSTIGICASDGYCVLDDYICKTPCENYVTYIPAIGYNKTVGMCPEIFQCYVTGGVTENFVLQAKYYGDAYATTLIDSYFICGLYNRGDKTCISGATIPTTAGVSSFPKGWSFGTVGSNYIFYDISVSCSDACNLTYEFCPYGCNQITKNCNTEPTSPEGQVKNVLNMFRDWWYVLFPTIYDRMIIWIILSLVMGGLLEYAVSGRTKSSGIVFGITALALAMGGVFIDQVIFEVMFILVVLSGFLVWRIWNQRMVG
jgi:hypothetical protein